MLLKGKGKCDLYLTNVPRQEDLLGESGGVAPRILMRSGVSFTPYSL